MKKTIYRICVKNWSKHNSHGKKSHKKTMIANNFCDDAKVKAMPLTYRWLFLGLILKCGDANEGCVEITGSQLTEMIGAPVSTMRALAALESLQLVTYEVLENLLNKRNEMNRTEEKRTEIPAGSKRPPPVAEDFKLSSPDEKPVKPKPTTDTNRKVWESYRAAYLSKWKVEPTRNASVNAQIANFVKRVGETDAPSIIEFYVGHTDGLYIKSQHAMNLAVRDAEGLRTQWLRGKTVTSRDIRQFENQSHFQEQLAKAERGEI